MAEKKNISSGAEKAEKLSGKRSSSTRAAKKNEETKVNETTEKKTARTNRAAAKSGETKETKPKSTKTAKPEKKTAHTEKGEKRGKKAKGAKKRELSPEKIAKMKKSEEKRLERAKIVAEKKQAKLERKLAHKEARLEKIAALKDKREQRKEARRERRDMLKSESKEAKRERIAEERQAKREAKEAKHKAYLAEKKAKREHALKLRAQKRAERNDKRAERAEKRRSPGFGGWLAAVISLGVTTLALGTVVTFGWLNMNEMQADMAGGYSQSLYELNSVVDNLDANLARAKASSSANDRVRVLTDIAVESETAETILERFPLDMQMTEQLSSFINKMGDSAKSMLYTVANGGELTSSQKNALNYMYETNAKVKEELNRLVSTCDGKDLMNAMRGKSSAIGDGFATIQNNSFQTPKGIQDGPFSDSLQKTNPKALKGAKEITAPAAEKLALEYFASYKPDGARCTGEVAGEAFTVYNVNLSTPDGEMLVQLSKLGGKVVAFDSFKDCADKNFSVRRCIDIAEDFLASVGYSGLKPVWVSENGTTCNLNFAPVQDGAILYPDLLKVKVCEERGIVTGMEARSYVLNHGARDIDRPVISEDQARSVVNGNMEITSSRKAVIPFDGGEVLCYEFVGTLEGNDYYVYVDAASGEEIEVLTVIGTAQGKALM